MIVEKCLKRKQESGTFSPLENPYLKYRGSVAQLVEQLPLKQLVARSNRAGPTRISSKKTFLTRGFFLFVLEEKITHNVLAFPAGVVKWYTRET